MLMDLVTQSDFSNLMSSHINDIMIYLFEKEQNFGILCKIEHVGFEPELPEAIANEFREVTLFFLAGYTYETARIEANYIIFEAGFGTENIGSVVSVPLSAIMQIIVDETPIFISLASPRAFTEPIAATQDSNGVENSMAAFLSNPENAKFNK